MEGTERRERRYNTRFRGVPQSVFTHPRTTKKQSSKQKCPAPLKADLRDDFVYTKLGGKKRGPTTAQTESENGSKETAQEAEKEKTPSPPPPPASEQQSTIQEKEETRSEENPQHEGKLQSPAPSPQIPSKTPSPPPPPPPPPDPPDEKPLSNGVHHSDTEPAEEPVSDTEKLQDKMDADEKDDCKLPPFKIVPTVKEFVVSSSGSNSKSVWITSKEKLSFNDCNVASYNPKTKMFRCVICQAVGFMTRIGEHYLGTHCNTKVFQCPQCSYCSAWWRCVRNHMSKHHGISNAPASMWKNQPLLDEIMQLLQNLKYSVDCEDRVVKVAENSGKRYICPKCPYATDRRDLYNRHENIHREEKPFQCYICYKLFNRADHVKKHFCRIHKDYDYDINLIRRLPSKRSRLPVTQYNGTDSTSPVHQTDPVCSSSANPVPSSSTSITTVTSSTSPSQSKLLNCLTGPPTMVRPSHEVACPMSSEVAREVPKENIFKELPSSLINYLTRPNFPSKPPLLELPQQNNNNSQQRAECCSGKQLQEGILSTFGYPAPHGSVPKEFICPYCPWRSADMWALRMHTATHYNNVCVLCNFRSTKESDLEAHMWDCHRKRPCNKCDFLADSIMVLDTHMKEMHSPASVHPPTPFRCRVCSQSFGVRSDMEAHSIFIHNQVLRECRQNGCGFCSTDPQVLQDHTQEKHCTLPASAEEKSASRTQCLYCGCDFADNTSLCLHEQIFHENPLQIAGRRPLDPYACAVCGYATPKQLMMIEHLRVHTGQELCCRAGDGCRFCTPYDTVLREHILQCHSGDDGIVRCPHCGFPCSTRSSFTSHYEQYHHPFCCVLCEEVEHKHFVSPKSSSYLDSTIAALFPFAKKVSEVSRRAASEAKEQVHENRLQTPYTPKDANIVETVRRSRKQSQPRKIVQEVPVTEKQTTTSSTSEKCRGVHKAHRNSFISFYAKKLRRIARTPVLQCRLCMKYPVYFRHKKNFVFHISWHRLRKQKCNQCVQTFRHRYQVLLHKKREHKN